MEATKKKKNSNKSASITQVKTAPSHIPLLNPKKTKKN